MTQPQPEPSPTSSTTDPNGGTPSPKPSRTVPLISINVPNVRGQALTNEQKAQVASHVVAGLSAAESDGEALHCTLVNSEIVTCQHPDGSEGFCQVNYYECEDGSSYEESIPL